MHEPDDIIRVLEIATISGASMKNITITLDEKIAAWARVHAAQHNKSATPQP